MRMHDIKRKFMRNFGIGAAVCVVAAGLAYGAVEYQSSNEDAKKQLDMQVQSARNQALQLQNKANRIRSGMSFYETITGSAQGMQGVDRAYADDELKNLNDELMLTKLTATISPVTEVTEVALQSQGIGVVKSDIELGMQGVSDELLLNFIRQIKWRFPGYVRINSLSLKRNILPEDDTYSAIVTSKELPALAEGVVKLQWLGLRKTVDPNAAANASTGAPNGQPTNGAPGMPGLPSAGAPGLPGGHP